MQVLSPWTAFGLPITLAGRRVARGVAVAALVLGSGCNGEGPTDDGRDTDTDTDPDSDVDCVEDDECGNGQICEDSACLDGDRDNAFTEATPILLNTLTGGEINPPGDADYFVYTSPGEEWLRIETITEGGEADTVVSVYASNGALHAYMDDYATGAVTTYDTVQHVYLPTAGDWYVKVQDATDFYGTGQTGGRQHDYTLELKDYSAVTDEPDSSTNTSYDVDITRGTSIWSVGVVLGETDDTDWIGVKMPFDGPLEVYGVAEIPGSDAEPTLRIWDGDTLLAYKQNVGPDGIANYFDATARTYTVETFDADHQGGADYWYVLYFRTRGDAANFSGYDREVEPNDTRDLAQPLDTYAFQTTSGLDYVAAQMQGALVFDGDEDWFTFEIPESLLLTVRCSAESYGSLVDLAVELYDPSGALLETITSGDDSTPDAFNLGRYAPGYYSIRVYAEGADIPWGPGAYYRCFLPITDWDVAEG